MQDEAPSYFDLSLKDNSGTISFYFERLSDTGEWESEEIFTHDYSSDNYAIMIDTTFPFTVSFSEKYQIDQIFKYITEPLYYPRELRGNKSTPYMLGDYWISEDILIEDKLIIGYLVMYDVSILTSTPEFIDTFSYDKPNTDYPDEIEEIYAMTIAIE